MNGEEMKTWEVLNYVRLNGNAGTRKACKQREMPSVFS
jgi:hypothetical protein